MSYILESLKRAERDRKAGQVPDLGVLYEEAPKRPVKRFPGWQWMAALLLLNAFFFAGTVFYFTERSAVSLPDKALPSQESSSVAAKTPEPPARTTPLSVPEPKPSAPPVEIPSKTQAVPPSKVTPLRSRSAAQKPVVPKAAASAEPDTDLSAIPRTSRGLNAEKPEVDASVPRAVEPSGPDEHAFETESFPVSDPKMRHSETQTASVVSNTETEMPLGAQPPVGPVSDTAAASTKQPTDTGTLTESVGSQFANAHKSPSASENETSPVDPGERVPYFRELRPELRERFSHLTLNVLVYYDEPDRSLVYINFRRYRTGDGIDGDDGLRIDQILAEGVILDYGDGRFMLQTSR